MKDLEQKIDEILEQTGLVEQSKYRGEQLWQDGETVDYTEEVNKAKQQLLSLIDEEKIKELGLLKTRKVKGANLVEMKWLDRRLQALKQETK